MNIIKRLDSGLINKIAAGEVVERPVSVVKELTENAIDAGCRQVTIEIKEGGISYIRVTDNGSGIPGSQLETAFLRHATSKIESLSDLEQIMTLGFRGEALSSIASVAQVEMITKTIGALTGSRIEIHGGELMGQQEAGCPEGTTIVVRNLFYNTPARFKFLKKPAAEGGTISDMVGKLALGHPEIGFTYVNNSAIVLQCNGNGDLKTAILQVYGKEIAKKVIWTDYQRDGYHLDGYVGRPEIARNNRVYENFFINGRYVKSELVRSAVEEAFRTKLLSGKFPFFVLNLKTAPDTVDVNVHPTKLEVRFSEEEQIYQMVREAVDLALREQDLIPEVREKFPKYSQVMKTKVYEAHENQDTLEAVQEGLPRERKPLQMREALPVAPRETAELETAEQGNTGLREKLRQATVTPSLSPPSPMPLPSPPPTAPTAKPPMQAHILGQVFQTYWIVEQGESVYFIDQHAAHERITYEELVALYKKKEVPSQRLLQPVALSLSPREKQLVEDYKELLESFGFELDEFGETSYALRSVPFIFTGPVAPGLVIELIDRLAAVDTTVDNLYDVRLDTIASISCKAAVKANDRLSDTEARALVEKLLALEEPFTCPHGRPTIIEMTKRELERRFKRT